MLAPFFAVAMTAPARQLTFRRVAVGHAVLLACLAWVGVTTDSPDTLTAIAQLLLALGLVEGAALVGWRLTQLPKSQALEFLLVSPVQPRRVFLAEALVGVARFALVSLAGLPVLGLLVFAGRADWSDLIPLAAMPFVWGTACGLAVTAWVYEPASIRRVGELFGLLGVLLYLVVGVMAGENLRQWLLALPEDVAQALFDAVIFLHTMNPFGVQRYWFDPYNVPWIAEQRMATLFAAGGAGILGFGLRAGTRLKGHFHDRHYKPQSAGRAAELEKIGDRPLSWWAVRRVMEYSGRVNLWLAGGFALAYAAFIVAGDSWPAWMGRLVFQMFDGWGGPAMVGAALAVLAGVPAAYQFGLWDATPQDRCKRLELLLLTDLSGNDYFHASLAAAWTRGRGYMASAVVMWLALGVSGRAPWYDALAAGVGGLVLWAFAFAVGFRGFATGNQTNGVASLLTLGLPFLLVVLLKTGNDALAAVVPTAACYLPAAYGVSWSWAAGLILTAAAAWHLGRRGRATCDANLRKWYDANQGTKVLS